MQTTTSIVIPRGAPGLPTYVLDMSLIYEASRRLDELRIITPQKAPELLTLFNKAYLEARKLIAQVTTEFNQSERYANKIKSIILLERAPIILKQKGLSSSSDLRQAVIDGDEEYQQAQERSNALEGVLELLKGHLKAFEMAYTLGKKLIDEAEYEGVGRQKFNGNESETWGKAKY